MFFLKKINKSTPAALNLMASCLGPASTSFRSFSTSLRRRSRSRPRRSAESTLSSLSSSEPEPEDESVPRRALEKKSNMTLSGCEMI
jgi:hypothetical protein